MIPWELRVAVRYLTARRKQAFISLISAVAVLGVTVGVMALLVALGLMTGLQSEIRARILGATAHVSVYRVRGEPLSDVAAVLAAVRRVPGVVGAAPALHGQVLLSSPMGASVARLKGVVPADERTVTEVIERAGAAAAGLSSSADGPAPVLLGSVLARSLGVEAGDLVTVTSPRGRLSPFGMLPSRTPLRVVGTVKTGLFEFDSQFGYLPLAAAERLFDASDSATFVEVRLRDMFAVKSVAKQILAALGPGYVTTDWIEMNGSLFSALLIEKIAIGITIGLIVAVAALNIVATLVLMVMEKHKDIAILVSMGASRRAIMRLFMLQGTIIGAVGTTLGGVLGWAVCYVFDRFRLIRIPEEVYQVSWVPFKLLPFDAAVVLTAALLVCFVATLYPAWGAARLDPAEALRYE